MLSSPSPLPRPFPSPAATQVIPTPLTRLRWWRVCLDEAQMVESTTAKAAEMALMLHTVHRWCVRVCVLLWCGESGADVGGWLGWVHVLWVRLGVGPHAAHSAPVGWGGAEWLYLCRRGS